MQSVSCRALSFAPIQRDCWMWRIIAPNVAELRPSYARRAYLPCCPRMPRLNDPRLTLDLPDNDPTTPDFRIWTRGVLPTLSPVCVCVWCEDTLPLGLHER